MAWTVLRPIARSGARRSMRGSVAVRATRASRPSSTPGAIAPADVGTVGGHAIERGRGPEVHDHGRRPVQPGRGEDIHQTIRTHLIRSVHPDRERHAPGIRDDEGDAALPGDHLDGHRQTRHDRRE